jgi:hypothetical protein
MNRAYASADALFRKPTAGIAACRARAASGHATDAPPRNAMNSRRFIALTPNPRIMASIAGQGPASQQKRPAHGAFNLALSAPAAELSAACRWRCGIHTICRTSVVLEVRKKEIDERAQ